MLNTNFYQTSVFLIILVGISIGSCTSTEKQKQVIPAKVDVAEIVALYHKISLDLAGEITASSKHDLSFLVAGQLTAVTIKEGDVVHKNQHLASIDDSDYQQALRIAKSKLDEANDQYKRLSNMFASGSLAEADFNKIKLLKQEAEANYQLYKNKLAYTNLNAPVSGTVSKVWLKPGTAVTQGQPVITIINDASVYARIKIPEVNVNDINLNDSCEIFVRAIDQTLIGTIYKISPSASKVTRTYETDIILDNAPSNLRDGMLCSVTLYEHATKKTIVVPLTLVSTDAEDISYVFTAHRGIAKKQRIITGKIIGNDVEVESGLEEGDTIITLPPISLMDGDKITY